MFNDQVSYNIVKYCVKELNGIINNKVNFIFLNLGLEFCIISNGKINKTYN